MSTAARWGRPAGLSVVLLLVLTALATGRAQAATGDLSYSGCVDPVSAPGCQQLLPAEPTDGAVVSPDGKQVYVLESTAGSRVVSPGSVATLTRAPGTQALAAGPCLGGASGCTALTAPSALALASHIAIAADGSSLDVIAPHDVIVFTRDATTGTLTEGACLTTVEAPVTGCTQINKTGLNGLTSLALSPDGSEVWVGSSNGTFTELSQSGGTLSFVKTFSAPGPVTALAMTSDGAGLLVAGADFVQSWSVTSAGLLLSGVCTTGTPGACMNAAVGGDSVAVSPDGASVYVASSTAGTLQTITRSASGALSGFSCLTSTAASGCTAVGNDVLDAPQSIAVSPDGRSVYSVGNVSNGITTGGGLAWFGRASGGALSFSGCIEPQASAPCTTTGSAAVLDGALDMAIDPDGFSVYTVADQFNPNSASAVNAVGSFVRDAPPACTSPPPQTVLVTGSLSVPLSCRVPAGHVLSGEAIVTQPTRGTLSAPSAGHVTYTPAGTPGSDSFSFTGSDDAGTSAPTGVNITVNYVPGVPSCQDASVSTLTGQPVTLPLHCTTPAGQTSTLSILSGPTHGSLGTIDQSSGTVTYTSGTAGDDQVEYIATDQDGASAPAHVTITVTQGQAPPSIAITGVDGITRAGPTSTSVQVHLSVNGFAAATTYQVGARILGAGGIAIGSPVVQATGSLAPSAAGQTTTVTLTGLSPYLHYQIGAAATNAGGTTDSNTATVDTGAEPGGERVLYTTWGWLDDNACDPCADGWATLTDGAGNPLPVPSSVEGFLAGGATLAQFSGDGRHVVWQQHAIDTTSSLVIGPADLSGARSLTSFAPFDGALSLTVSPDGSQVAWVDYYGVLWMMNTTPGARPIRLLDACPSYEMLTGASCGAMAVAFSPVDPDTLAVTYDTSSIEYFASQGAALDAPFLRAPRRGPVELLLIDPRTGHLAVAAGNLLGGNDGAGAVDFLGGGQMAWSSDGVRLWLGDGREYAAGHVVAKYGQPLAFTYAPGEPEALESDSTGKGLQLIDTSTGAVLKEFAPPPASQPGVTSLDDQVNVRTVAWDKPYGAPSVVLGDVARSLFRAPHSGRVTITFTNATAGTLKLTSPSVISQARAFTIISPRLSHTAAAPGPCAGATLAPGAQCAVEVQFRTAAPGTVDALVYPGDPTGQLDPATVVGRGRGFAPTVKRLRLSAKTITGKSKPPTVTFSLPRGARYRVRVAPVRCVASAPTATSATSACTAPIRPVAGSARRGGVQRVVLSGRSLRALSPGSYVVSVDAVVPGWESPVVSATFVRAG